MRITESDVLNFLKSNKKSIALSYIDMPGIDTKIAKHKLHVNLIAKSVKQNAR